MRDRITNERGEEISKKEFKEIVNTIRNLEADEINRFFFRCGFIEADVEEGMGLAQWRAEKIKDDEKFGEMVIDTLFQETTPKKDFLEEFDKLKKRKTK